MSTTKVGNTFVWKTLAAACLAGAMTFAGCSNSPKYVNSQPDVNSALKQNNLDNVQTSQDRDKGILTLTGTVPNSEERADAREIARTAAPTYTIVNQIAVVPPAAGPSAAEIASARADSAIEAEFKAQLKKHPYFRKDDISIESKDMTVTLSGTVRTTYDKRQAEKIAKAIPNVKEVVNKIEVKRH